MSMCDAFLCAATGVGLLAGNVLAAESPNLGRIATPEEIATWDIDVMPDGRFLPPGSGNPQ